jgi:hypothetical protein
MQRFLICLALAMGAFPVLAQDYLPRDVQRFVDRREGCDQVRGERERMNEVSRELRKLCGGSDKELGQLKRKYAANSTIMQILNQFEAGIEVVETGEAPAPAPTPKSRKVKRAG